MVVSVIYPHDHVADWELWPAATAQLAREHCVAYRWAGKRPKCKIPSTISTECILLLHHRKVEKSQGGPASTCTKDSLVRDDNGVLKDSTWGGRSLSCHQETEA